jgi:phosphotriesterase-related protein
MPQVPTVRGAVDAADLGAVLMHEHVFTKNPELEENFPHPEWDEERLLAEARASLESLVAKGFTTMVDMTVLGIGRSIGRIQRLAEGLPMHLVVATGYYTAKDLPPYFRNRRPGTRMGGPDPLEEIFVHDVEEGIADTGVRAAVIKVVSDANGITSDVERVFAAAARTHARTGVPVSTHSDAANRTGLDQQRWFLDHGVDPASLVIGHSGDSADLDYLREMADHGSTLGMDRFGMSTSQSDAVRVDTLVALCEQGYADRMVLSQDAAFFSINTTPAYRAEHVPTWNHHHLSDHILPELRRRGVTEEQLTQMTVTNPARLLGGRAA